MSDRSLNEIATDPPAWALKKSFFMGVVFFTLIGFGAMMLLELTLQFHFGGPDYQLPHWLDAPVFLTAAAPGFLFGIWFGKKTLNKAYWRLTGTELLCGTSGQQKFPLSSIEKIIVGLPVSGIVAAAAVDAAVAANPQWNKAKDLWQARDVKGNSLLICFKDGSLLPLRLFAIPNGTPIMEELMKRFKDRLILDHNYSREEKRRLRSRDINELIPAPKTL